MNKTAPEALKRYIIEYANENKFSDWTYDGPIDTEEQLDAALEIMRRHIGSDAEQDIMCGDWETDIELTPGQWSRHCEVVSVAVQDNYGSYIGFPHYRNGGKHFDDSSYYDFSIDSAYFLSCEEKEVLTIQRSWVKIPNEEQIN